MTPVQGIHPDGPVSEKGPSHSCDRFSGSLDTWIDLHPPILSDPLDTLEEVFGLGQKTSRDKQIRFLSVFLNRAENDAWPWIGEKPTPLTRLKAGSSQGDGTCLHFSGGLGRSRLSLAKFTCKKSRLSIKAEIDSNFFSAITKCVEVIVVYCCDPAA